MRRNSIQKYLLGGTVTVMLAAACVTVATPASAVSPGPPKITAHPNNLMVTTFTTLTGTNFPPHTTLNLTECSSTIWPVGPPSPCDTNNTVAVVTGAAGGFTTKFRAELCPGGKRVGPTAVRCYIGAPKPSGIDTMTLVGAVKITVTYP